MGPFPQCCCPLGEVWEIQPGSKGRKQEDQAGEMLWARASIPSPGVWMVSDGGFEVTQWIWGTTPLKIQNLDWKWGRPLFLCLCHTFSG